MWAIRTTPIESALSPSVRTYAGSPLTPPPRDAGRRRTRLPYLLLSLAGCASAGGGEAPPAVCTEAAALDETVNTYFDLVSGPAGERIPPAFTALFLDGARLDAMGVAEQGRSAFFPQTPTEYVHHLDEYRRTRAFYHTQVARETTCYLRSASVEVRFESRNERAGPLIDRGLLSMHLLRLDDGWRFAHVQWHSTPD